MALVQRKINVSFTLSGGRTFQESGGNVAEFRGLRCSARVSKAGGRSMSTLQISIYGLTLSIMNQLSTLGQKVILVPRDSITITAGDDENGMFTVFTGTIKDAYADFSASPQVPFNITANAGLSQAVNNAQVSSFNGSTDVATIMSGLASKMQLTFENNGVSKKLASPYLYGSLRNQAYSAAEAAGISLIIDNGKLAIWPRNGSRGGQIPLVSPDTGLVGYPAYTAEGISLKTIFNPSIVFGGQIKVQSSLTPANKTWAVFSLDYELDSLVPHGSWFCHIGAFNPAYLGPVTK